MARKALTKVEEKVTANNSWQSKAREYIDAKAVEKDAKDTAGKLNTELKDYLTSLKGEDKSITVDDTGVFLSFRSKDVWDEEKMIEYLKQSGHAEGLVKTKEYIDFDALESVLYNNSLPAKVLKKLGTFKTEVQTAVLNIIKPKKGA